MFVASEEATFGSVIAKHDLISPSRSGSSHCFFCSAVPNSAKISIFPVSGAEQLKTSDAKPTLPNISANGAYSRLAKPNPFWLSGRKKFQSPCAFALDLSSSSIGGTLHGFPSSLKESI